MRADRLLSILSLLQVQRQLTAPALAQRLEVSARTIHRDMEALSAAGVPVYAQRGAGGGWVLPEGYRTELTGLSAAETQALFVGGPSRLLADGPIAARDSQDAVSYALGFGPRMTVLEPAGLRERVAQSARETLARYEQPEQRRALRLLEPIG